MACRVYLYRIGASKADNQDGLPHLPMLNIDKQGKMIKMACWVYLYRIWASKADYQDHLPLFA